MVVFKTVVKYLTKHIDKDSKYYQPDILKNEKVND